MKATRPKTLTITQRDFDRAVSIPWSIETCVLAQAAKRNGLQDACGGPNVWLIAEHSEKANALMAGFDDAHRWHPSKRNLAKLRASLPIKVVLS